MSKIETREANTRWT